MASQDSDIQRPADPTIPPPPPAAGKENKVIVTILAGCGCAGFVGIILLFAILLPVISQARQRALQRACSTNLQKLVASIRMYSQDWDETLPPANNWTNATLTRAKDYTIFRCPVVAKDSPTGYGYAFDSRLSAERVDEMSNQQSVPLLFDSTILSRNAVDTGGSFAIDPPRHRARGGRSGANVGFVDGHVQLMTAYPRAAPKP